MIKPAPYRVGKWLPTDHTTLKHWLGSLAKIAKEQDAPLSREIAAFKNLIESDPEVFMFFNLMFTQVPDKPPYDKNPNEQPQVENYTEMLRMMNHIMKTAPVFLVIEDEPAGLIGFPINAILDWSMGTTAGFAAFLNDKVNRHLKLILNAWGKHLLSEDSANVLNESPKGWFGPAARKAMPCFKEEFICDPDEPHWGFSSWDDFFTRRFRPDVRPIADPDDENIIVNACESAPYKIATNVKNRERFWIKGQPYSISHMLADDQHTEKFVGGTVYQAFLSALSYHRWHSPVTGTVVKTKIVDGSYYSEALMCGFSSPDGPDKSAPNDSQGYLTEVATRGLIFIEADNKAIGLMCFMAVGMAEVSSCDIRVKAGDKVTKGQETGMFHFGGSTHCLIFRKGVNLDFFMNESPGLDSSNINVNARIAIVREPKEDPC